MKKRFLSYALLAFGAASLTLSSCKKDKDEEETHDEEVITTLRLTFTPAGGSSVSYQFDDPDGPGGNNPVTETIRLQPNTTYSVAVQLLNKTVSPAADLTGEVAGEAEAHRFYYAPSAGSGISVTGLDNDGSGIPLGLTSTWTTGAAATGNVQVTLRHYPGNPPNKAAADPVNSSKSGTDVDVNFPVSVQ